VGQPRGKGRAVEEDVLGAPLRAAELLAKGVEVAPEREHSLLLRGEVVVLSLLDRLHRAQGPRRAAGSRPAAAKMCGAAARCGAVDRRARRARRRPIGASTVKFLSESGRGARDHVAKPLLARKPRPAPNPPPRGAASHSQRSSQAPDAPRSACHGPHAGRRPRARRADQDRPRALPRGASSLRDASCIVARELSNARRPPRAAPRRAAPLTARRPAARRPQARDAFFACWERHKAATPFSPGAAPPAPCRAARAAYESACPRSWVRHFDALRDRELVTLRALRANINASAATAAGGLAGKPQG
jgi:cytochrome c oxidase assembly factor 6